MLPTAPILLAAALWGVPLVEEGEPRAALAPLDAKAPVEIRRAADELQRVLEKMTGVRLGSPRGGDEPIVHIGRDAFVDAAGLDLDRLDPDGFVIRTVGERHLILAGRTPHATEFAVYRFLSKYGGVRWFFPTALGEVVPKRRSFCVGHVADCEEPSFHSRQWSVAAPFDGGEWERHNLCRARYNFHHNLRTIFVPSKLYDAHPDWFPQIDGKRCRPKDDQDEAWQPCLANTEATRHAAQAARQYFDAHPAAACFSIGMNDTAAGGFCMCAACRALDPTDPVEQKTPRGLPNYSNRFFTFANRVAAELARTHPQKYLGCLAYNVTEPPPSFNVQPQIIPYLTAGRANWTDPAIREGDQRLIRGWCRKVPIVGIYDYYYGSGFVSPRIFIGLSEASLKFAHQTGVRAFYAEIYSTWSLDGPKAYVASQLLWNVHQSADALVDDFCRGLFGKAAAPMRAYFRFLEQRWMTRPGGSTVMWHGFFDAAQLELWPPAACAEARRLLVQAEEAAKGDDETVRQRVKLFGDGFHQTELWSTLYYGERSLRSLAELQRYGEAQAELERFDRDVIQPHPLHRAAIAFRERASHVPGGALAGAVLRLADQADAQGTLERLAAVSPSAEVQAAARAALCLRSHPEQAIQRLINPGLELGVEKPVADVSRRTAPPGWGVWFRPATSGQGESSTEAGRSRRPDFQSGPAGASATQGERSAGAEGSRRPDFQSGPTGASATQGERSAAAERSRRPDFQSGPTGASATQGERSAAAERSGRSSGAGLQIRPTDAGLKIRPTGKWGYVLRGAEASCLLQSVPVQPGEKYLASVYVRGKLSKQAESKLLIQWKDAAGQWLTAAGHRTDQLPAGGSPDWTRLCVLAEVPAQAGQLAFCVSAYNQAPDDVLQIDDASLQRVPQEPSR